MKTGKKYKPRRERINWHSNDLDHYYDGNPRPGYPHYTTNGYNPGPADCTFSSTIIGGLAITSVIWLLNYGGCVNGQNEEYSSEPSRVETKFVEMKENERK